MFNLNKKRYKNIIFFIIYTMGNFFTKNIFCDIEKSTNIENEEVKENALSFNDENKFNTIFINYNINPLDEYDDDYDDDNIDTTKYF